VILTVEAVEIPLIVAIPPETDQLYVIMPPVPEYVLVVPGHTALLPVMVMAVAALMVIFLWAFAHAWLSVNTTGPEKLAAGVKVTLAGSEVWAVLLNVPEPLVMDQAAVVPAVMVAPVRVIGAGVAEEHILLIAGPAFIVVCEMVMTLVSVTGVQFELFPSGSFEVSCSVTDPEKPAVGVNVTPAGLVVKEVLLRVPPVP
jgi:hypothetical protein